MKQNLSDLLDQIQVQDVELKSHTPLSPQRIKELTMKKVNRKPRRTLGFKLLVAAVIVVSLSMTAFAAEKMFGAGDIFRDVLNGQLGQDKISENQVDVINKLGKVFEEQTYMDQGTTITAKAAYGDEYVLNLYLSVTAPEGTVLPDDITYTLYDYNASQDAYDDAFQIGDLPGDAPYHAVFTGIEVFPQPDQNPGDNQKDFWVMIYAQPGESTRFNDGYTKNLPIYGIYRQVANVDGDEDGYELLVPCEFLIDLTLSHQVQAVELDVKGLTYGGTKYRTWTHDSLCQTGCEEVLTGETDPETGLPIHAESWKYSVTAESFTISPMRVTCENSFTVSDRAHSHGLDFRVVMKDGTSPMLNAVSGGWQTNESHCNCTLYFTVPIDLNDVDYILIGDEDVCEPYKLYLPESE